MGDLVVARCKYGESGAARIRGGVLQPRRNVGQLRHFPGQRACQRDSGTLTSGAKESKALGLVFEGVQCSAQARQAAIHLQHQVFDGLSPQTAFGIDVLPRCARAGQKVFGNVDLAKRCIHDLCQR